MLSAVASATQDSRFERLKNLKPPALPGDSYYICSLRRFILLQGWQNAKRQGI
jgi:hypothetical protein